MPGGWRPRARVRRDAKRHEGRWEERAEWGKGRVAPKLEHASDVHEGRWEERAGFKGVARRDVGVPSRHETPQERAARIAAEQRAYAARRDGGDVVAFDEETTLGGSHGRAKRRRVTCPTRPFTAARRRCGTLPP